MSAPSVLHEDRVEMLRAIATLSGFRCDIPIGAALVPDVARLSCTTGGGLFIGEAKATETSGCEATSERLQRYVQSARAHPRSSDPLLLVVAHGDLRDEPGWVAALNRALTRSGFEQPRHSGSIVIDEDCVLAYAICSDIESRPSGR